MEILQIMKKDEEIPENLIDRMKECTRKIIKDIGHWSKVIGYDE